MRFGKFTKTTIGRAYSGILFFPKVFLSDILLVLVDLADIFSLFVMTTTDQIISLVLVGIQAIGFLENSAGFVVFSHFEIAMSDLDHQFSIGSREMEPFVVAFQCFLVSSQFK